jgi:hypothetical protein
MESSRSAEALRYHLSLGDGVVVNDSNTRVIGKIVKAHGDGRISLSMLSYATSDVLLRHSLSAVTDAEAPFAVKSGMVEVIQVPNTLKISRSSIVNVAFIVPLAELESGSFHVTGAVNTYFARFIIHPNGTISPYNHFVLQARLALPVTYRFFRGLNTFSSMIKRALYHQPEEHSTMKTVRLQLCYDAFSLFGLSF